MEKSVDFGLTAFGISPMQIGSLTAYATIRKYQPEAMIINNRGLSTLGEVSHQEIDSVTFERGKPTFVDTSKKPIAGEMCEGITEH